MGLVILSGSSAYLIPPVIKDVTVTTIETMELDLLQESFVEQLDGQDDELS